MCEFIIEQSLAQSHPLNLRMPYRGFHTRERGYVRCVVTPGAWASDYVAVEDVTRPGGRVVTRASFAVEAGMPGAKGA